VNFEWLFVNGNWILDLDYLSVPVEFSNFCQYYHMCSSTHATLVFPKEQQKRRSDNQQGINM
jgi:hypothetical protein